MYAATGSLYLSAKQADRSPLHGRVEPVGEDPALGVVVSEKHNLAAVERFVLAELGELAPRLKALSDSGHLRREKQSLLERGHELLSERVFLPQLEGTLFVALGEELQEWSNLKLLSLERDVPVAPLAKHGLLSFRVTEPSVACRDSLRNREVLHGIERLEKKHAVQFLAEHLLALITELVELEAEDHACFESSIEHALHLGHLFRLLLLRIDLIEHYVEKGSLQKVFVPQCRVFGCLAQTPRQFECVESSLHSPNFLFPLKEDLQLKVVGDGAQPETEEFFFGRKDS